MPDNMCLALRRVNDLAEITETITDYYPCHRVNPPKDSTGTTPFSVAQHKKGPSFSVAQNKEVSFDKDTLVADSLTQLSLAMNTLQNSNSKPFKPYATPPSGRGGRGRSFTRGGGGRGRGQSYQSGSRGKYFKPGARQNTRTNARDNGTCNYCREYGHWKDECPKKARQQSQRGNQNYRGQNSGFRRQSQNYRGQNPRGQGRPFSSQTRPQNNYQNQNQFSRQNSGYQNNSYQVAEIQPEEQENPTFQTHNVETHNPSYDWSIAGSQDNQFLNM